VCATSQPPAGSAAILRAWRVAADDARDAGEEHGTMETMQDELTDAQLDLVVGGT
jgi:hypothetical protein